MSEIAEEKVFKFFFALPEKARMEVFNEMQPDDRCRLTRCSKQCNTEAKSSPQFMNSLSIYSNSKNLFQISVLHQARSSTNFGVSFRKSAMGFNLDISHDWEEKHMTYRCFDWERGQIWRVELDDSTDLVEFGFQVFQNQLRAHQKSIKILRINMDNFNEELFSEIDKFDKLEELHLDNSMDVTKILPKLTRPLNVLMSHSQKFNNSLAQFEEIYQVKKKLFAFKLQLNNEQFRRLSASQISLNIGQLTEMDVFHFIKAWQRGEVRENFESFELGLSNSLFDVEKLYSLLGVEVEDDGKKELSTEVAKDNDSEKTASLEKRGQKDYEYLSFRIKGARYY